MKKLLIILACLAFVFSGVAYASVAVQDSGTNKGPATTINFSTGMTVTGSGSTKAITVTGGAAASLTGANGETFTNGTTDDEWTATSNDEAMTVAAVGFEAKDAVLKLDADEGDDDADTWFIKSEATGNDLSIVNHATEVINIQTTGATQIDSNLTLGAAAEADVATIIDGNAQDFYIGLDDSEDDLVIGLGSTVGTTPAIAVDENQDVTLSQNLTVTDGAVFLAELQPSDETVTCVTEAGTADPDITISYIVTDGDADTDEDTVSLADGTAGEIKIFVYKTETDVGDSANVTPTNFANGTKILFEDPGDGCIMVFDGTNWSLVSNVGGTVS